MASKLNHPLTVDGSESRLPAGEWRVLQTLSSEGPGTVPQIARRRSTSRQNIQVLVNRLREAGYVTVESNPAHKRSVLIELTGSGRALLGSAGNEHSRMSDSAEKHVTRKELASATRVLRLLRQALGGQAGEIQKGARVVAQSPAPRVQPGPKFMEVEEELQSGELPVALL